MALLSTVVAKGTHAARPAAGSAGVLYYETDTYGLFRDNGATWDQIAWPTLPPAVRCYNSANINVANTTTTALTFDSNRYDQGAATAHHSTVSNTSRLTCQVAGLYDIKGQVRFDNNTGGNERTALLRLNGSTALARSGPGAPTGTVIAKDVLVSTQYLLAVGDYVELCVYQDSGGAMNVIALANSSPEFMMVRVG